MKTAVSLPDPLFDAADRMAKRLGMPRSRLYAEAVEAFINAHHDAGVKEALNALYGTEPSKLDRALAAIQVASLPEEDW